MSLNLVQKRALLGVYLRGRIWDWTYRVETTGVKEISGLSVLGSNRAAAVQYEPISPDELDAALALIQVPFENYTFVDFGSGKGRALLMAAQYPYRRIVGVEFAGELHDAAVKNIARFRGPRAAAVIQSVHGDAAGFPIPSGPLVIYLNNPFGDPVMASVVHNISDSWNAEPRHLLFLTVSRWTKTQHIEALQGVRKIKSGPHFNLFELPGVNDSEA